MPITRVQSALDDGDARIGTWRRRFGLVWLMYLALYFIPWTYHRPSQTEVIAAFAGLATFLVLFFHAYIAKPRWLVVNVVGVGLIGFALTPFSGWWTVYLIYALTMSVRLKPRWTAFAVLIGFEIVTITVGLAQHGFWYTWGSGAFFGLMSFVGAMFQYDLECKNRQLAIAQEEVRQLAATAERERISRDLHDLLGHTLTLVAVKAELAARLAPRDAMAAGREMQEVADAAREALSEVRTAVAGMRGASLNLEIERARRMLAVANVEADILIDADLGDAQREAVFAMTLREAVTNVIRHAGASHCAIRLEADEPGQVALSVVDNGVGGEIREGSGLKGMRARLAAVGGVLTLESGDRGARLLARMPAGAAA